MDDTTTQVQQPSPVAATDQVSSMSDVAGMTPPPPAPVMPVTDTASTAPQMPAVPMATDTGVSGLSSALDAMPQPAADQPLAETKTPSPVGAKEGADDYSYAEDVLNEILDALDRIEAKLEAMEKKG